MSGIIPLAVPNLGGNELKYLTECVDDNWISSGGEYVRRFERDFAAFVGAAHGVACASGTAALHVALRLAGAGPGKLVAVSDFTFIASVNAVAYTGADVLLVDSEPSTWNMDTSRLHDHVVARAARGERIPDIVEVVHILGHPADLEPLIALRDRFDIVVVEDAAEALGASYVAGPYRGRQVGTIGEFGCFSFNGNKIITTGGGGMIVTGDADLAAKAKHLTEQAKRSVRGYLHDEIGYNYRLTNLAAAVGVAQLEQLPGFLAAKRRIAARYGNMLVGEPVATPPHAAWADPSYWLYSILLEGGPDRERVLDRLEAAGILARPVWPPVHMQQPYEHLERLGGEHARAIYESGVSLPSSTGLTDADQDRVVVELAAALA